MKNLYSTDKEWIFIFNYKGKDYPARFPINDKASLKGLIKDFKVNIIKLVESKQIEQPIDPESEITELKAKLMVLSENHSNEEIFSLLFDNLEYDYDTDSIDLIIERVKNFSI